jgi:hypothetical protein
MAAHVHPKPTLMRPVAMTAFSTLAPQGQSPLTGFLTNRAWHANQQGDLHLFVKGPLDGVDGCNAFSGFWAVAARAAITKSERLFRTILL